VTRVLIAYEDSHRSYGEALAGAVRGLRPDIDLSLVQTRDFVPEVARFDPHLVICNRPGAVEPDGEIAWVGLSDEPGEPSVACVGGHCRSIQNPDLGDLLAVIDEAEGLVRGGSNPRGR